MSKRRSDSDSSDSEEQEMPRAITLASIPTLRYLYKNKTLVQCRPRFPHRESLLDRVSLFQGDITRLEVDAIVNAANRSLLGGGGVDGAIHQAAGSGLLKECRTLGGADTGDAKITGGYKLPSKHVIHAVGPIYSSSERDIKAAQLEACYENSIDLAIANKLSSIAFCSISTGIYGYPIVDATHIALQTTREILEKESSSGIERVIFVVWSDKDKHVYQVGCGRDAKARSPENKAPEPTESTSAATEAPKSSNTVAPESETPKENVAVDEAEKKGEPTKEPEAGDNKETVEVPKPEDAKETVDPKKDDVKETVEESKKAE
ncbi:O-acetyl-ADP-ribose deacetylase MACROD1; AltName: Full=MACRO domain-containing protein 1; AltName: Full=Protein LRP16; AltName: Full=[Protein ADP-ribosylglutamate] hydrolase; Flags: Fragment [Serendipita indica DSM 11827]|nr:O-acetyl-ADP-ribose deacetylase MACROD1; AltName: Full=MACRO domain-containing protein 1; AltName: Full=Protein LRP16; AltName: Full=[Protein ADP-ribosylglutamate] hydrolase; Flags: Fragment [Serendipita indica DSM 11827]